MGMIEVATAFALAKHEGQTRKFSGEPYVNHPIRVYNLVKKHAEYNEDIQAAALLHDVLEDTNATEEELKQAFGKDVLQLVKELTNPVLDKTRDREVNDMIMMRHWRNMSDPAALVKICDRIDNLSDIPKDKLHDKWTLKYTRQSLEMCHIFSDSLIIPIPLRIRLGELIVGIFNANYYRN